MPYMMNQETRDQWDTFCFYEAAFSQEECEKIIEFGKLIPSREAVIGGEGVQNSEKRKTKVSWIEWSQQSDAIFTKLAHFAADANRTRYKFNLSGFLEPIQFTQYLEPDDHYDWHQDSGGGRFSIRKLSMVLQLSDSEEYEGANLEFFTLKDREVIRKRGTVFVFPSFEIHRVTPLIKGTRYSLVSWISGPPFA